MTHFTVGLVTATNADWVESYRDVVPGSVARHGGRYLARGADHRVLEGDHSPTTIIIIEWPSQEAEARFFADPEYAPYLVARRAGSISQLHSVPSVVDEW